MKSEATTVCIQGGLFDLVLVCHLKDLLDFLFLELPRVFLHNTWGTAHARMLIDMHVLLVA